MNTLTFEIYGAGEITNTLAGDFINQLGVQGKVQLPTVQRIQSCHKILFCKWGNTIIGIGAIKPKTASDFDAHKANLPHFEADIAWELGYMYVNELNRGMGLSSTIVKLLLKELNGQNIMASTELYTANPMVHVLQKNGFILTGNPWKSSLHDGYLGLFIRFKKGG